MKITRLRTHVLEAKLSQPFAYSRAWYDTRTASLVEIETDTGLTGWGECYGPARMTSAVVQGVAPWLIGEDPLRTDALGQMIYARLRDHGQKGVVVQGLSGIDIALWDIKGKHFGVPVHRLLGGPLRTEVRAYATGLYRRKSGDPLKYLAEEAAGYAAEGFTAVKLKVGFGVEEDAAVTRAVREAIGPGVALMVDANHAFDAVAAIRLGRMIEAQRDLGKGFEAGLGEHFRLVAIDRHPIKVGPADFKPPIDLDSGARGSGVGFQIAGVVDLHVA